MTATTESITTTTRNDRFRVWTREDPNTASLMREAEEQLALDSTIKNSFAEAEADLLRCSLREGDVVEVMVDNADGATVSVGDTFTISRRYDYGTTTTVDTTYGWVFRRGHVRLIAPADVRADLQPPVLEWFDRARAEFSNTCGCPQCVVLRQGVDHAFQYLTNSGRISSTIPLTAELKEGLGSELRRARHLLALRFKEMADRLGAAQQPAPEPEPMPERNLTVPAPEVNVDEMRQRIEQLERDLTTARERVDSLRARRDELSTWQSSACNDAEIISEKLSTEARNRGWCSEYDEIINYINGRMQVLELRARARRVTGTVTGTVTIGFSISVSDIEVESEDDVDDALTNYVSENYTARQLIRDGYGSVDWSDAEIGDLEVDGWEYE